MVHSSSPPSARDRPPAPGPVALVQAFLNTADIEDGEDLLDGPAGLKAWLEEMALPGAGPMPSAGDVARAVELREAIRDHIEALGHGDAVGDAAVRFERVVGGLTLHVAVAGRDVVLEGRGAGVDRAFARIVSVLIRADADGSLERLKVCRNTGCRWAFWDASRNRSGTWCTMAVCGNRSKGRAFRKRERAAGSASA